MPTQSQFEHRSMQLPLRWQRTRCVLPLLLWLFTLLASEWPFARGISSPCWAENPPPKLTADKLFDPTHVVNVEIELSEGDWNALRQQTRALALSLGKTPAEFQRDASDAEVRALEVEIAAEMVARQNQCYN